MAQEDTYLLLNELLKKVLQRDFSFLLGDFNSKLRRCAGKGELVGQFCMHMRAGIGGLHLEKLKEENRLRAVYTCFEQAERCAPCTYIRNIPGIATSTTCWYHVDEPPRYARVR